MHNADTVERAGGGCCGRARPGMRICRVACLRAAAHSWSRLRQDAATAAALHTSASVRSVFQPGIAAVPTALISMMKELEVWLFMATPLRALPLPGMICAGDRQAVNTTLNTPLKGDVAMVCR